MPKHVTINSIPAPKNLEEAKEMIRVLSDALKQYIQYIDELEQRIDDLENQLTGSTDSSKPPSSDTLAQRAERQKKKPTGKKKGAQPSHKGQAREALPAEHVNESFDYYPGQCPCGERVEVEPGQYTRHQKVELPEVNFHLTEHRLYKWQCCQCGESHRAQLPDWVDSRLCGPRLIAYIGLLSDEYRLSNRQIQGYLSRFYGLN